MSSYRCYFLGSDGKIIRAQNLECPSDEVALETAEHVLENCGYPTIEIWERARRVGTVVRNEIGRGSPAEGR